MPGGDRTGPQGMGAMSGRAAGYCSGSGAPGYANPVSGRGGGRGWARVRGIGGRGFGGGGFGGGGRGWRNMFHATGLPGWMRFGGNAAPYAYPAPSYAQPDPQMEKQALTNQAEALRGQLEAIQKRLGEMEARTSTE
jgi:hypothetical protein